MPRIWYIHKFYRGQYRQTIRVPGTFEQADKLASKLNRRYGNIGWGYEISDTPTVQAVEVEAGLQ